MTTANTSRSAYFREYRQKLRTRAIMELGGRCACCGEEELAFLTFDHMAGGGRRLRARNTNQQTLFNAIIKGTIDGIQVLCANCNMAKERPEGCPHGSRA